MPRATIAAAALLTAATAPAGADWQYTKWGMTVNQVMTSSKGQMKNCGAVCEKQRSATETALLYAPYQSGDLPFTAFAFFDNQSKKLAFMSLRLDDPSKGFQLIGALKAKYGEPASSSRSSNLMDILVWRVGGDQIDVTRIGFGGDNSFTLAYRPRVTNSNKGL
jgi:hypothetical protein